MGLRNAFPKERQYEFWNMLMCFLIHKQEAVPEKDRMLFGTLAYRMMSKAAEAIVKNEVCQTPAILAARSDIEAGADSFLDKVYFGARGDRLAHSDLQLHRTCRRLAQTLTRRTSRHRVSLGEEGS